MGYLASDKHKKACGMINKCFCTTLYFSVNECTVGRGTFKDMLFFPLQMKGTGDIISSSFTLGM